MDGNGTLFGTLSGNTREILHKFTVDLPKKHGRGGQSALRFARLRMEKRHNYVRKVGYSCLQSAPAAVKSVLLLHVAVPLECCAMMSRYIDSGHSAGWLLFPGVLADLNLSTLMLQVAELATQMYITNDKPNVSGLVLSGSADFKTELSQSDMFDPRLQAVVLGVVDVSYGEQSTVSYRTHVLPGCMHLLYRVC